MNISQVINKQREYFQSTKTLSYQERKKNLSILRSIIIQNEQLLIEALFKDLGKSAHEAYMTEIGVVLKELTYIEKHLKKLMKPKKVKTSITDFPASSNIHPHPYGTVLIISPWNYPVNLTLSPLIGALASGNTVIIKPSEYSVHTSVLLEKILNKAFDPGVVKVINGDVETGKELLEHKFDYIFFTGSTEVGKKVMEKASKYLTPISLELGGKSPTIIDKTANIKVTARRIVFGKYINAGQTCVAPDYLYVHKDIKSNLVSEMRKVITEFYTDNPLQSDIYPKIINKLHFNRLLSYIENKKVLAGGNSEFKTLKIEPTILDDISIEDSIMKEEIFGPILPIIEYENINEVITFINSKPSPLALYLFTEDKKIKNKVLNETIFGGGCINDTIVHVASDYLPFGGVGESGVGVYHGESSFKTFSHFKSVLHKRTWLDLTIRYAPFTKFKSKLVRFFLK